MVLAEFGSVLVVYVLVALLCFAGCCYFGLRIAFLVRSVLGLWCSQPLYVFEVLIHQVYFIVLVFVGDWDELGASLWQ